MKNVFILIILSVTIFSCDLVNNLTEIDIESEMKFGYQIELNAEDNTIYEEEIISLTDDEEVEKYKDNLENVGIDSILISVSDLTGQQEISIDGKFSYSKEDGSDAVEFYTLSDFDVAAYNASGETFKLNVDQSKVENLSKFLLEEQSIKIFLNGTASNVPCTFDLDIKVFTNVTVQALD